MDNLNSSARMLLVSRESSALGVLWDLSRINSWQLEIVSNGLEALERLDSEPCLDIVLIDLKPGDSDGLYTLRWLRKKNPELSVVVLAETEATEQIREAVILGAHDCLLRPYQELEVERAIKLQLSARFAHYETEAGNDDDHVITDLSLLSGDPAIQRLRTRAQQLAQMDVPVLLLGEGRNSKEVVARLIHKLSARSRSEFLKVNCGSFASETLERELFGYERPAVSGGLRRKEGKFEQCRGGTVLLDELAEMSVNLQNRVLGVLDKSSSSHSGNGTKPLDIRLIAAVNVDVEKALAERKLSEDLYYRLSAFTVYVPRLKDLRKHPNGEDANGLKSLVRSAKGEAEKKAIAGALEETHWNRKAAARLLQISYRALLYKIQEYQMRPPEAYISQFAAGGLKGNGQGSS